MSRTKAVLSLITLVVLSGLCLYLNRDWFSGGTIHIYHRISPARPGVRRGRPAPTATANPLVFGFDKPYRFTRVKVVPLTEFLTNKYVHPLWELVSESNSVPTGSFVYGANLRGMHPRYAGARPDPLQPDVKYRLLVETSSLKADHDFSIPAPDASGK